VCSSDLKVWLDNGSYLVIDQTEALTVIDVNTGKFTGSTSLEDTVFQTNLGAVSEIARQIRLRNLAGIMLIDFIDMSKDSERERVMERLQHELEKDKAKVTMLGFTSLGLLEFTRKKVRPSLRELLQVECEFCEGTGYVISTENQTQRASRAIRQLAVITTDEALLIGANPQVASLLIGPGGANLERMERYLQKRIFIKGQETLGLEQVKLLASGSRDEIAFLSLPVREQEELEVQIDEAHASNVDDGIARLEGYVIHVAGAGEKIGEMVKVRIVKTTKTHAKAEMIG
jgi:ribonuclease G